MMAMQYGQILWYGYYRAAIPLKLKKLRTFSIKQGKRETLYFSENDYFVLYIQAVAGYVVATYVNSDVKNSQRPIICVPFM
jgi:hypothetical protein